MIRKEPPRAKLKGMSFRLSLPTIILPICGIMRPTQFMLPLTQTAPAVARVVQTTMKIRADATGSPRVPASLSPMEIIFIR